MAQAGSGAGGISEGSEFHLPDEILSVLPTDPYEQLDLARKITSMAIASRISKLDLESGRLRQSVEEKDRMITELQEKLAQLDRMFQQADSRLRAALEENIKLAKERDSLAQTTKKLARDLAKLETFKKQLMQSLSEDSSTDGLSTNYLLKQKDTVDIKTFGHPVAQGSPWEDEVSIGRSTTYPVITSTEKGNMIQNVTRPTGKFSAIPPIPPRLTPTATPKVTSTGGSPKGFSTTVSPKFASGATSPTKPSYEGLTAMSPWFPSSKQSSAASSPPQGRSMPGRSPRVDGKEFFRQARSRLSYEQFGAFLANIKELNAHRQSREETLKKAEEIFGPDNKDLYLSFQGLLMKNLR